MLRADLTDIDRVLAGFLPRLDLHLLAVLFLLPGGADSLVARQGMERLCGNISSQSQSVLPSLPIRMRIVVTEMDLYLYLVSVFPVIFQLGVGPVVVLTHLAHVHLT